MPLIKAFNENETYEDQPVDAGKYDLRIKSAKLKASGPDAKRPGAAYIQFAIGIEGADGAATVFHNTNIPWTDDNPGPNGERDEAATARMMMRDIKRFFAVFGIPLDADLEEENIAQTFEGATGNCQLRKIEARDRNNEKTGDWKNELVLPRVS